MVGSDTVSAIERRLKPQGLCVRYEKAEASFKFGNDGVASTGWAVVIPFFIAGRYGLLGAFIITGSAPLLIANKVHKVLRLVVDHDGDVATSKLLQAVIGLNELPSGHYEMDICGFPEGFRPNFEIEPEIMTDELWLYPAVPGLTEKYQQDDLSIDIYLVQNGSEKTGKKSENKAPEPEGIQEPLPALADSSDEETDEEDDENRLQENYENEKVENQVDKKDSVLNVEKENEKAENQADKKNSVLNVESVDSGIKSSRLVVHRMRKTGLKMLMVRQTRSSR